MRDDLLREVLSSPLEEHRPASRIPWVVAGIFVAAALVALGTIAGIAALATDPAPAAAPTTTAAPTSTTEPPPETGAAGLEVAWEHRLGDRLLIAVTTTAAPGDDPRAADWMRSANWVLQVDESRTVSATAEHTDPVAPGLYTITFPAVDLTGPATLLAYPATDVAESTHEVTIPAAQFPLVEPLDPIVVGGETLELDLRLDDGGGTLRWTLGGDGAGRAALSLRADYTEVGEDGTTAQRIMSEQGVEVPFLSAGLTYHDPARRGTLRLYHLDDPDEPTFRTRHWGDPRREVAVEDLTVVITVLLQSYGEEPLAVPFDPISPVTATG